LKNAELLVNRGILLIYIMDFNYTKIKIGNWMYKYCYPLYKLTYFKFKLKNDFDEIRILKDLLKPGDFVLDVGANIGFYGGILSNLVGNSGMVYCFEPNLSNFNKLKKNVSSLKNVKTFNCAVSDKSGSLKLYTSKLLNVDHRTYPVNNYDKIEEIEAISIDDLVRNGTISKVDFIKIDIQGYELQAFRGMMETIQQNKYIKIIAEFWPHGFLRAKTSAIEIFDFFDELKFSIKKIEDGALIPIDRTFVIENNHQPFEYSYNVLIEKQI
jgi:FkbM family methyltransferase